MLQRLYSFSLTLLLLLLFSATVSGQDLGSIDFQNMEIDQLTELQIRNLSRELDNAGISLQQAQQLAQARGMSQLNSQLLINRIQMYRQSGAFLEDGEGNLRQRQELSPELREMSDLYGTDGTGTFAMERDTIPDSLRVFGMDLFGETTRTFEPSMNIPTPEDYELGPGDQLVINVWGAAQTSYTLVINPEGNIQISNIGPIHVSGLTITEASEIIISRLATINSGLRPDNPEEANSFADVRLGDVKSIRVTIAGEVDVPGTYTVSSLATAFNALYAAGGPTRNGSFREVQIIRNNEVAATFDLYDFLVFGDQTDNIRLRNNDLIRVAPYKNRVHVTGEAKRIGFFEMTDGETFEDLVTILAGFTEAAYTRSFLIERRTPTMRSVTTIRYPEEQNTEMRHGDKVIVQRLLDRFENKVTIQGAVMRPGGFELRDGMSLYDLIVAADGLREDAYMTRGTIERVRENRERETIPFSPENVVNNPALYDMDLRNEDAVRISSLFDMREEYSYRISGAVNEPGEYQFLENTSVKDAIFLAAGFTEEAAAYRIEVARRVTGEGERMKMDQIAEMHYFEVEEDLRFDPESEDFVLRPFDRIYIRTKPNYQTQQTVRIEGEVQFPGEYVLENRSARISDLIDQAGGISAYGYPEGAALSRRLDQDPRLDRRDLPPEVLAALESGEEVEVQQQGNGEMDEDREPVTIPRSQVAIRLQEVMENRSSPFNLILQPGDIIRIPKELETVRIEGEVLYPVSVRYNSSRSFRSYLDAAGGPTESAHLRRAYVVYANGEVDRTRRFLFFRNNPSLEPGATIVIPPEPERRELTPQERISLASSIASTALLIVTLVERLQ
ncbi:MAG: SLBB domain-containing protein [Balneolaceae bacterium]